MHLLRKVGLTWRPRLRPKHVIITVTTLITLMCVVWFGARTVDEVIAERTTNALRSIREKTGFRIDIGSQHVDLGSVRFESISVQERFNVEMAEASVSLGWQPWSSGFGGIGNMELQHLKARLYLSELDRLVSLLTPSSDKKKSKIKGQSWLEKAPGQFLLRDGEISIHDDENKEVLGFDGLNLAFVKEEAALDFDVRELRYHGGIILQNVTGRIVLDAAGDFYPFVISQESALGEKTGQVHGQLKKDLSQIRLYLKNKGIPALLSSWIEKYVPEHNDLNYAARIVATRSPDRQGVQFGLHFGFANLRIQHPLIGRQVVGPTPIELKAIGKLDLVDRSFAINRGNISFYERGQARRKGVHIDFNVSHEGSSQSEEQPWHFFAKLEETTCQDALDSLPANLAPRLASFKINGSIAMKIEGDVMASNPSSFQYKILSGKNDCKVTGSDAEFSAARLLSLNPTESLPERNPYVDPTLYTPFHQMSRNIPLAFLAAEDSGFWHHKGFEWSAIEAAMRKNVAEHGVVLGGSTVSMQTAKNLFLSNERNLSRKLQEVFLTWHLEETLPKQKIFEIYANIIEFGPGIFGIAQASKHFFNKTPAQLSLVESVYLASVLPNPVKRYRNFCNGGLSQSYREMVNKRLERMMNLNMISAETFSQTLKERLDFVPPERVDTQDCWRKIAVLDPKNSLAMP